MNTFKINPLRYALSSVGLRKGRSMIGNRDGRSLAKNTYILDMWHLTANQSITVKDIDNCWNISIDISTMADSLTSNTVDLTSVDVNHIYAICRKYIPELTELELAAALTSFNSEPIPNLQYTAQSMLEALHAVENDKSILEVEYMPAVEQRYLVSLTMSIIDSVKYGILNIKQYLQLNGFKVSSDNNGNYICTTVGKFYY